MSKYPLNIVVNNDNPSRIADKASDQFSDYLLPSGGGGGTFDGMEARVAKLESDIDYIKRDIGEIKIELRDFKQDVRTEFKEVKQDMRSDFRILFGALIAAVLGLAGLMARGFHWI